jgi:hypothetical protein
LNAAGSTFIQVVVNPVLPRIAVGPQPIAVPPTSVPRSFLLSLTNADNVGHTVSLASSNAAVVTVSPASVVFAPGETEKVVSVTGRGVGVAAINLSSPILAPTSVPVFVTAEFSGVSTSFAPPLGVTKGEAGAAATPFGPFTAPLVGVARGAYIEGVSPNRLAIGSGPTNLVVNGNSLSDVSGVSIVPPDGLTLGPISVAPDGRSVTVPVTVAANAPATVREVRLAGASQPYVAARPGAEQLLITLAPPQIESIEPIVAVVGSTAMTLTVRGRNLQGAQSVALTPSTGIFVSNTPSVNDAGTILTIPLTVGQFAPTGPRVVTVTTQGGTSEAIASPANTFSVVNVIQAVHTPIAAANVGVLKQEAPPPAAPQTAFASQLGVALGPVATGVSPAVGIIGESVTLTISGFGLTGVTAVQFVPSDGLTVGALSVAPDGRSLTVSISVAANAVQTLRELRLLAGASQVLFADPAAPLFRVSAPLPVFDSMSPIVLQVGAPAVTLKILGRNFLNATQVRVSPPAGITVSPPSVTSSSEVSVTIAAAAGAATGPRAVILATPAGESSSTLTAANTLTLVNTIQGAVTPIVAPTVGVILQDNAPPPTQSFGPFASPDVGVVLETAPAAPPENTARANNLGVVIGPFSNGVQVPPLTPSSTGTLVISGAGLGDVTAVQVVPPTNITVGTLTIAPDGTRVTTPLTLSGASAGIRGVRVLRGSQEVPFEPAGTDFFYIGIGVPSIDSITPIVERRGQTFTMTLRGQNFQDVVAVTATPGFGILIDNAPSVNAAGEVTVRISIASDAPLGAHVMRVHTRGGATTDQAVPANTFTVLE